MARGICKKCGKTVGKMLGPKGFKCPRCKLVYCGNCAPVVGGLIKKKLGCPDCGVELIE